MYFSRICLAMVLLACGSDAMSKQLNNERIICSIIAAIDYQIPANIVLAVAEIENGKPWHVSGNGNGTLDYGPMQFNTVYLEQMRKYGITEEDVLDKGCYPYQLAAWRLRGHIVNDRYGDIYTRAANYHSYTPKFNSIYRAKLIRVADKWANWISARFKTREVTIK